MAARQSNKPSENYIFNYLPNRYLHKTWWQTLDHGDELEKLAGFGRMEKHVSEIILRLFNLSDTYHREFNTPLERVALLPESDIHELAHYLGLCLTHKAITQSILKAEKLVFQQQLEKKAYSFAMTEAQTLCNSNNCSESYPVKAIHIMEQSSWIGLRILGKALAKTDKALTQRLVLKLGKPYAQLVQKAPLFKPLTTSQPDCIALVESVAQYLELNVKPDR
ncbi:MAG: SctK family type III secretion system sorting platform protein [Methylococcales bacterium]|nr:SctK family type III secretion system sorting platform protein [Methylococcales bacterium]